MGDKRTSPIWEMDKTVFQSLCENCSSRMEVLSHFGMTNPGNLTTLNRRIVEDGVNTTHFVTRYGRPVDGATPLEDVLVKGSTYPRFQLKKRLLREGLLKNECAVCKLGNEWKGAPIVHRIDHINGDSADNRIENLRMLCPNCDSQQPTFAGRNKRIMPL